MRTAGRGKRWVRGSTGAARRRGCAWACAWALAALAGLASPVSAQTLAEARSALFTGAYEDAERAFRTLLARDPASAPARRGLIDALLVRGRRADAEAAARQAPDPRTVADALGEVLALQGKLDEAEAAFRLGAEGAGPERLAARAGLAELLFRRGREDEAMRLADPFIDVYNGAGGRLTARELVAAGRAVHLLARRDPALFQDALRAFDEASRADPGWAEPATRAGDLFLEKYQSPEAQEEFAKVLAVNPRDPRALLGQARALDFDGAAGARERLEKVLELDPGNPAARVLLARTAAAREDWLGARAEAERALRTDPTCLEALSVIAAGQYLSGDRAGFEETRARTLALNPRYGGLDATVAETAVQLRRYREAAERARAAVALDSLDARAWGLLGMNQLRTGRIAEGRASLERAFRRDPYNPWYKNSLDLLDTFARFRTVRTAHFELFLNNSEADLLEPWIAQVAEAAYDSLHARYGVEPPLPIRVELFPSHADFSVRTLGEPGLGALGVSFGSLLILDSPAARAQGEYSWASTLWHETAHAFHLAMSDHRVPRWFSEGLSVHEQHRAREGWGLQATLPFLRAFRDGRLKEVGELDDGFMRPAYPEQVVFTYYQSSLLFRLIEERHGFPALRAMLGGYRRGESTEALLASVLSTTPAALDAELRAYMEARFAGPLKALAPVGEPPATDAPTADLEAFVRSHPGDLVGRLRLGARLTEEERWQEARPHLTEAVRLFPEYGGPDSPYIYLARLHAAQGDPERAAAALARLNALSETNYEALVMQAELLERLARPAEAMHVLARAVLVWPYDPALHQRLAELASANADRALAVRARQAVVALNPVDRADAFYRLALAQRDAGDRAAARRSVLRALEVAPNFEPALELLLELREGRPSP